MKFKKKTILFRNIVGSHMWGQHHSESDIDKFEVYIFDTRSFMLGERHDRCKSTKVIVDGVEEETISCEIGHVIEQLMKGNINHIWGVMSPKRDLVTTNIDPTVLDLQRVVSLNLSRATVHSIRGFVIHNLKHWYGIILDKVVNHITGGVGYFIKKRKIPRLLPEDKKYWKILNTCARTLGFGITLLREGILDFDHPIGAKTTGEIITLLNVLELAYKGSNLPDKPDPVPFEEYLLWTRFNDLKRVRNR